MTLNYTQKLLAGTLALVLIAGLTTPAFAQNPNENSWSEVNDAGPLPDSSQKTVGSGPLTSILGSVSTFNDVDMYCISITDPNTFEAQTGDKGAANFDTILSLFNSTGGGVYLNDDFPGFDYSNLDSTSEWAPTVPGKYLLAISSFDNQPFNSVLSMLGPFDGLTDTWQLLATVDSWDDAGDDSGEYDIALAGVEFCAEDVVAGELLPLDSTALFLAGIQSMTVWMIPSIVGLAGVGIYLVKYRANKE